MDAANRDKRDRDDVLPRAHQQRLLMRLGQRDRAFTIVEILVGLAILALLAAMLFPTVGSQLRQGSSAALANQLDNLRQAIGNYRQNVVRFPFVLANLTIQPGVGALDACGTAVPAANRALWRGPYINQNVPGNLPVGNAIILSQFVRVPAGGLGQPGILQIIATNVDSITAVDLEQQFDGNANFTTGTVLWTTTGVDTLKFQIPIRGC
jgi:prepilin-type N-terminal cleavage/methylation domain-containing protein